MNDAFKGKWRALLAAAEAIRAAWGPGIESRPGESELNGEFYDAVFAGEDFDEWVNELSMLVDHIALIPNTSTAGCLCETCGATLSDTTPWCHECTAKAEQQQRGHDVAVLDAYERQGYRVSLHRREHNADGERAAHGGFYTCVTLDNLTETPKSFWSTTDEPGESEDEARHAAAEAIENGEVAP